MKLVLREHRSPKEAIRRMTARMSPSDRAAAEGDLAALAGGSSVHAYVRTIFELEVDDLAGLLFRTMQRAAELGLERAVMGRRLRILWALWGERFENEEAMLTYLAQRWPPEEGPFRESTGFFTKEIRSLLVPPQLN